MASESFCRRNYKNSAKTCDLILDFLRIPHQDAIKWGKILPWGVILVTHRVLTWLFRAAFLFLSVSLPLGLTAPLKTASLSWTLRMKHLWGGRGGRGAHLLPPSCFSLNVVWEPPCSLPTPPASVLWPSGAGGLWGASDDPPEQPGWGACAGAGRLHGRRLGRGVHTKGMSDFAALVAGGRVNRFLKM